MNQPDNYCGPSDAIEVADALSRSLTSMDPKVRTAAAEKLGDLGLGAAALRLALRDRNPHVRSAAARALGNPAHPDREDIVDELRGCIHDPNDHVAAAAIYALGRLGATDATDEIASYLDTSSRLIRLAAVRVLGQLDARSYAASIASLLDEPDPKLRSYTIAVLRRLGHRDSAPRILEILVACSSQSSDDLIINNAIHALADFGHKEAIPALIDIACTRFGHRTHAVRALLRLKAYHAAPSLVGLYHEKTATLPQALTELMIAADYRAALPHIRRLLHHTLHDVRLLALKAVALWHDVQSLPQLRYMALHEGDPLLASQAMATCHAFDPRSAEKDLVELVKGQRLQIARAASALLRDHGVGNFDLYEELRALATTVDDAELRANLEKVAIRQADEHATPASNHVHVPPSADRDAVAAYLTAWLQAVIDAEVRGSEHATLKASLAAVLQALRQPNGEVLTAPPLSQAA